METGRASFLGKKTLRSDAEVTITVDWETAMYL